MDYMSMFLLNRVRDENNIFYMILFSFCITLFTNLSRELSAQIQWGQIIQKIKSHYVSIAIKENEYCIEGHAKRTSSTSISNHILADFCFPEKLEAINLFIIANQHNTRMVVSEAIISFHTTTTTTRRPYSLFVCDVKAFVLCNKKQIYCSINSVVNTTDNDTVTVVFAKVHSPCATVEEIDQFLVKITEEMNLKREQEKMKASKPLVYTLCSLAKPIINGLGMRTYFSSIQFESTRSFQNMFFDNKQEILTKLDFFLNNKKWYYDNGIPYSLGIGLHGPPGTGKTSFIKALANYTNRNIVIISLKEIKNKADLESIFFSTEVGPFQKKIIVFEDIDCIGDIVLAREFKFEKQVDTGNDSKDKDNDTDKKIGFDPVTLTLDDILNLFDGIIETPGRIMVMTSNHYDKLDTALTRPGRIDMSLHLSYASRQSIAEMYNHFYKKQINPKALAKIPDKFYTPAEIVNTYVLHNNKPEKFVERLQQAVKVK